jgi:hypothetical protein
MLNKKTANGTIVARVDAVSLQTSREIQNFGTIAKRPIALESSIRAGSVENLNQVLADTKTLAELYKLGLGNPQDAMASRRGPTALGVGRGVRASATRRS